MARVTKKERIWKTKRIARTEEGNQAKKLGKLTDDRSSERKWAQKKTEDLSKIESWREKSREKIEGIILNGRMKFFGEAIERYDGSIDLRRL